uniref:Uncharacterized protein n=1 Tax=Sphaerodactylus townsendi TaxID=933632 RepID=A0ACB8EKN9_9SAUR
MLLMKPWHKLAAQQIVELKLEHEQEKTHLFQQHNTEKDCLVQDHEREIEKLEKQLRAAMTEHDNKILEFRKRDAQKEPVWLRLSDE